MALSLADVWDRSDFGKGSNNLHVRSTQQAVDNSMVHFEMSKCCRRIPLGLTSTYEIALLEFAWLQALLLRCLRYSAALSGWTLPG